MTRAKQGTQQQLLKQGLRRCVTCNEIKPVTEFYLRGNGFYTSQCAKCIRNKGNEDYRNNPEPHKIYQKKFYSEHTEYYLNYSQQHRTRRRVESKSTKYPRAEVCEECGRTKEELLLLGLELQRHHDEYDDPEKFRTLCTECHGKTRRKY